MKKNYGTNNSKAYSDLCIDSNKHNWINKGYIKKCLTLYECPKCLSIMKEDSSD